IYNQGGVFRTDDGGSTFKQMGDVTHDDVVSVDFTDTDRKTLLAGGHETTQKLWLSVDSGQNWEDIGPRLPSSAGWSSDPWIIDTNTFLVGVNQGIYRSEDAGKTWNKVSDH